MSTYPDPIEVKLTDIPLANHNREFRTTLANQIEELVRDELNTAHGLNLSSEDSFDLDDRNELLRIRKNMQPDYLPTTGRHAALVLAMLYLQGRIKR